jgi:hypothetical protein
MRTLGPPPIAGADENFAVPLALFAMKFINRHEEKITAVAEMFKHRETNEEGGKPGISLLRFLLSLFNR